MITSINKPTCIAIRAKLDRLLKEFGDEHGLTVSLGNAKFTSTEVRFLNTTFVLKGAPKREEKALEGMFARHGLKEFNAAGDQLTEFNRRRYAYPFGFTKKADGKKYKCSLAQAKALGF